ncbi:hypothetical protein E2C01_054762 [Portunus trituberculatus]|uniref:Uncharacterized protein n=1 Tax=Portunus trituberculatus TaxID=210409 RepID=A0A5B7GTK3_PORTR|nr:hypothetical protein [Portunus trituberculatus]
MVSLHAKPSTLSMGETATPKGTERRFAGHNDDSFIYMEEREALRESRNDTQSAVTGEVLKRLGGKTADGHGRLPVSSSKPQGSYYDELQFGCGPEASRNISKMVETFNKVKED